MSPSDPIQPMSPEILSEYETQPLAFPVLRNGWHERTGQSTLLLHKHRLGINDESFRVEKRIAADQSEFVLAVKSQRIQLMRADDFERILVTISTVAVSSDITHL